jgi:hypothetical protein
MARLHHPNSRHRSWSSYAFVNELNYRNHECRNNLPFRVYFFGMLTPPVVCSGDPNAKLLQSRLVQLSGFASVGRSHRLLVDEYHGGLRFSWKSKAKSVFIGAAHSTLH